MQVLLKKDLEAFKQWLDANDIAHRPGKGEWQIMQVYVEGHGFQVLFTNKRPQAHYTSNDKLCSTIARFYHASAIS